MLASSGEIGISHLEQATLESTTELTVVLQTVAYRGALNEACSPRVAGHSIGRLPCFALLGAEQLQSNLPRSIVAETSKSTMIDLSRVY